MDTVVEATSKKVMKNTYNFTNKFDCLYGFNYGVSMCEIAD